MRIWKPVGIEEVGLRVGKQQKRETFANGNQWEIAELSLEGRNLSSVTSAGTRDIGCRVAMLEGNQ